MFEIKSQISKIKVDAESLIRSCENKNEIEQLRVRFLGKKGVVTALYKNLKDITPEQRPEVGDLINTLKDEVARELDCKQSFFLRESLRSRLVEEELDVTLPGKPVTLGRIHPITKVLQRVIDIFQALGFSVAEGPEIEKEYYNFDALNIPSHHPARDMQDTFFIDVGTLLRTHTSPVQIRVMENRKPPVRVIAPGRVYRNEAINARSYCLFHQVEGFYVDKHVTFADLKGILGHFSREMFGAKTAIRIRPSYFPFTEPSLECDVSCFLCSAKGCRVCKYTGWLEILGAGMIHPAVLKAGGFDPDEVQGYAFGMGIERTALLLYGINDIRLFFENDMRFLSQF